LPKILKIYPIYSLFLERLCRNSGEAKNSEIGDRQADEKALERHLGEVRFRTILTYLEQEVYGSIST